MSVNKNLKKVALPNGDWGWIKDEAGRNIIAPIYQAGSAYPAGTFLISNIPGEAKLYRTTDAITANENTGWSAIVSKVDPENPHTIAGEIERLEGLIAGGIAFRGKISEVANVDIVDGAHTPTTVHMVVDDGHGGLTTVEYTPVNGDLLLCRNSKPSPEDYSGHYSTEFIAYIKNGELTWVEVSSGRLGELAYANTATGSATHSHAASVTVPVVSHTTNDKKVKKALTGVSTASTTSPITNISDVDNVTFVKSYPGQTQDLQTTTVYSAGDTVDVTKVVTNGVYTVAAAGTTKAADDDLAATAYSDNDFATRGMLHDAEVDDATETLSFPIKKLAGIDVTPAGSTDITKYTLTQKDVAGTRTAVTVATGKLVASDAAGDSVMYGLGTAVTDTAIKTIRPVTDTAIKTLSTNDDNFVSSENASDGDVNKFTYVPSVSEGTTTATVSVQDTTVTTTVHPDARTYVP